MHPCHVCRRHVRSDASTCPFCAATLRHDTAPIAGVASILLGLALMGCGDDGNTDTGADSGTTAPTTTSPTTTTTSPTTTESMTEASTGTFTTNDDMSETVAAYGDPSFDSSASLTESPESSSGTAESSTTDATGSESSGGTGSSGTDTGSSSNASDVSDSADYGGAAPPNQDR